MIQKRDYATKPKNGEKCFRARGNKAIPCELLLNTALGYCCAPIEEKSIAAAIRDAKKSGYFRYRVRVNGKFVRQGFCE